MSTEENKALVRRFYEAFSRQNTAALDQFAAADFVDHDLPPGVPPTLEGAKQYLGMFLAAFPDIHNMVEDMVAEGDKVVARVYFSGTHTGEFQGMPATGKQINIEAFDMFRIANGKL